MRRNILLVVAVCAAVILAGDALRAWLQGRHHDSATNSQGSGMHGARPSGQTYGRHGAPLAQDAGTSDLDSLAVAGNDSETHGKGRLGPQSSFGVLSQEQKTPSSLPPPPSPLVDEVSFRVLLADVEKSVFQSRHDAVMASWPEYLTLRNQLREELALGLPLDTTPMSQVIEIARGFRRTFWSRGGDMSHDAYLYAYKARALLEIAWERAPQNDAVMDELLEAIQDTSLFWVRDQSSAAPVPNVAVRDTLLRLRQEQFLRASAEIGEGHRAATVADFRRACDLAVLYNVYDAQRAKEVLSWLTDQVNRQGWAGRWAECFKGCYSAVEHGRDFRFGLYSPDFESGLFSMETEFRFVRRLPSYCGPGLKERGLELELGVE